MAERPLARSSRETYEAYFRKHIGPVFGDRMVGSLRRNEIQAFVNHLPVSPATAETVLRVLQSVLKAAVVDDLIVKSPAMGVKPPKASRRRPLVVPTPEEVEVLAGAIFGRYKVAVHLAAEAGLREGEILGLRVEDLDMLGRRLTVTRQAPDAHRRRRPRPAAQVGVRLPDRSLALATVEAIAAHLATYPAQDGLVVTSSSGGPVRRNNFGERWADAKERAGLTRPLKFHDLRHRYASVLIAEKADPLTLKTLMGHHSIEQTYDTYGHLFPSQVERAAQAIANHITRKPLTGS